MGRFPILAVVLTLFAALVDPAPAGALTAGEQATLRQALQQGTLVETVARMPVEDPAARAREILEFLAGEVREPRQLGQLAVEMFEGMALALRAQSMPGEEFARALQEIARVVLTVPADLFAQEPARKSFYEALFDTARGRSVADVTEVSDPVALTLGILPRRPERFPGVPPAAVEAARDTGFLAYVEGLEAAPAAGEVAPAAGPPAVVPPPAFAPPAFAPAAPTVSPERPASPS